MAVQHRAQANEAMHQNTTTSHQILATMASSNIKNSHSPVLSPRLNQI